jgi:hypothetical protein
MGELYFSGGISMSIAQTVEQIQQTIQSAVARRQGQLCTGTDVKLVAVTKNQLVDVVQEAIEGGISAIGENRVQEATSKAELLNRQVEWHLVGHLQTNKVRPAVALFDLIHSVDSFHLAVEIDKSAAKAGKCQDVLIQINGADEETKFGIQPQELMSLAKNISGFHHIRLCGLMAIAPALENSQEVRPLFRQMYELFTELKAAGLPNTAIQWLSMGMTTDYLVAVEEGANLVRIGTGIFGGRHYEVRGY